LFKLFTPLTPEDRFIAHLIEKYVNMLVLAGANILSPFGYTEKILRDHLFYGERQMALQPVMTTK